MPWLSCYAYLESMNIEIDSNDKVYRVSKKSYAIITAFFRLGYSGVGFWLGYILYHQCLFNPNSNTFVVVYIGLLSLACFQACGVPIDKLINLDLIKS